MGVGVGVGGGKGESYLCVDKFLLEFAGRSAMLQQWTCYIGPRRRCNEQSARCEEYLSSSLLSYGTLDFFNFLASVDPFR